MNGADRVLPRWDLGVCRGLRWSFREGAWQLPGESSNTGAERAYDWGSLEQVTRDKRSGPVQRP